MGASCCGTKPEQVNTVEEHGVNSSTVEHTNHHEHDHGHDHGHDHDHEDNQDGTHYHDNGACCDGHSDASSITSQASTCCGSEEHCSGKNSTLLPIL